MLSLLAVVPAAAQTPLLDVQSGAGDTIATLHTDSMRLLLPLHLVTGGIVFPDGSIQTTAPSGGGANGPAKAADSTSDATAAAVFARDEFGGFDAGPTCFSVGSGGSTAPALLTETNGSGTGVIKVLVNVKQRLHASGAPPTCAGPPVKG